MTQSRIKENLAAVLLFAAMIFGLSAGSGALTAGFSLTEDYEILTLRQELQTESIPGRYWRYQVEDFKIRFRPFNCLGRILESAFLGSDFFIYRFVRGVLGVITAFLLFLAMRWLGSGRAGALLFSALTICGPQLSTWWRLATYESWGLFFFAIALLALAAEVRAGKASAAASAVFVLSLIAASLVKESFMPVIPAFVFLRVWSWMRLHRRTFLQAVVESLPHALLLAAWVLVDLTVILKGPGPMGNGYAGYKGFDSSLFAAAAGQVALSCGGYLAAVIAIAALGSRRRDGAPAATLAGDLIFAAMVIAPSILLFQQTGFYQHYFLPVALGTAYLTVRCFETLFARIPAPVRVAVAAVLIAALGAQWALAFRDAGDFRKECAEVGAVIEKVASGTAAGDRIVIAGDPARHFEWTLGMSLFLELKYDRHNLVYFPTFRPRYSELEKMLIEKSTKSPLKIFAGRIAGPGFDGASVRDIVVLPTMEVFFLMQSKKWFDRAHFDRIPMGAYTVYRRKAPVSEGAVR